MSPEFIGVPCGADLTKPCTCQNSAAISKFFNEKAKDPEIVYHFNKHGFDYVSPQIVRYLVVEKDKPFYTDAFNRKYRFSPELTGSLRNYILKDFHKLMYFSLETDSSNILCPNILAFIADHNYDPEFFLQFLKDNPPKNFKK
jgi:hypothetical protein